MRIACLAVAALLASIAVPAAAQVHVSGRFTSTFVRSGGNAALGTFECTGTNPCIGTYRAEVFDPSCSNTFTFVDRVSIAGQLVPAASGAVSVTATFTNLFNGSFINPDGTCSIVPGRFEDITLSLVGAFDGASGSVAGTLAGPDDVLQLSAIYTADAAPAFPLVVRASVDARTATADADLFFRPQDAGRPQNVYVFALAPAGVVRSTASPTPVSPDAKADAPLPCVIAQLNASGALVGVTAAQMQAYVSGVTQASVAGVKIMDNVPTPQVAGATFYLGYGSSAAAMLASGTNRSAVTVQAASATCKPEKPQTGWWWNPAEGGRGFSIEVRGNNMFFASYLYDAAGNALWYAATGPTTLEGALFQGQLLAFSGGQTLEGAYRGAQAQPSPGPITLTFQDASNGVLAWPGGSIPIKRFDIVPNGLAATPVPNQPESGWWWNPAEGGRGFFLEWQGSAAFLAGYMYTGTGAPVWYASFATTPQIHQFAGSWQQFGNGQSLTGAYRAASVINANVGPIGVTFTGPANGVMTLPGGRTIPIERFRF